MDVGVMLGQNVVKKLISSYTVSILIILSFSGIFIFNNVEKNYSAVASGVTIIVDLNGNGNYTSIQDAIDNASFGDTIYVWEGRFNESITINKTLSLIGNGSANTTIAGNYSNDIITIKSDWVNISGFKIINSGYYTALFIESSKNCTFKNNTFTNNWIGIQLKNSNKNKIMNNNCSSNTGDGIYLGNYCNSNRIKNNTCNSNQRGIYIGYHSDNNKIENNTCTDNSLDGICIFDYSNYNNVRNNNCSDNNDNGIYLRYYCNFNILTKNNCSSNGGSGIFLYLFCYSNLVISNICLENSYNGIFVMSQSDLNDIFNNTCRNNENGISISLTSSFNKIYNNTILNNQLGIEISYSSYILVWNNKFFKCGLFIRGDYVFHWNTHEISLNNSVNNKPLYYWKNKNLKTVPSSAGQILLANCSNIIVNGHIIDNASVGIEIGFSNNIQVKNNDVSNNSYSGIYIISSDLIIISNNNCRSNFYDGIFIESSLNIKISKNNCNSKNNYGIRIYDCLDCEIDNNTCTENHYGIKLYESNACEIIDNICLDNYIGLMFEYSNSNLVKKNIFRKNRWGIDLYYSHANTIWKNICKNNELDAIYTLYSNNNNITENICSNNRDGISIDYNSNSNFILNNTCKLNSGYGIEIDQCDNCYIENNTCLNNYYEGIYLSGSNHNVNNNNCSNNNGTGIYSWGFDTTFKNNICENNKRNGIYVNDDNNIIKNNIFSFNRDFGIYLASADKNIIVNNSCMSNIKWNGINLIQSHRNLIKKNNCSFNNDSSGIYLIDSNSNDIIDNAFYKNNMGVEISRLSEYNNIVSNIIKNNYNGISIKDDTSNNFIIENSIINNSKFGIVMGVGSNSSSIYHNNFIDNRFQAQDLGNNNWYRALEGNYWSDYNGLDNGANDRFAGDGIGDTDIPHLDLDNYPFVNRNGWLAPQAPDLKGPKKVDTDGIFNLKWTCDKTLTGFILEEDTNNLFLSPTRVFRGIINPEDAGSITATFNYTITGKVDDAYFYRVLGYTDLFKTSWSNVVEITVELIPEIPKNFTISIWPYGNALNLSWKPLGNDIVNYELHYKTSGNWLFLSNISHPNCQFNHTGLVDREVHYYKIRSWNKFNHSSKFSGQYIGIPADIIPPKAPTGLKMIKIHGNSVNLTWNKSIDDDVIGYNIYRSEISNATSFGDPINHDMAVSSVFYNDTTIEKSTTYYYTVTAVDEVPLESNFSNIIEVQTTKYNLHFPPPYVNEPPPNFSIQEDDIDNRTINLHDWFSDENGEPLQFYCLGNDKINVTIDSEKGTVTLKPEKDWNGNETLVFYAYDGLLDASDEVVITIVQVKDPPGPVKILIPRDGKKIRYGETLNFKGECDDPDLPYGDYLTFAWASDISDYIGEGEVLSNIKLPAGVHRITLVVTDSSNQRIRTSINVTVEKVKEKQDSEDSMMMVGIGGIIIFIIFMILIMLLYFKKRPPPGESTEIDSEDMEQSKKPEEIPKLDLEITELSLEE